MDTVPTGSSPKIENQLVVPKTGLEPVRPFGQAVLSRSRLPIPPLGQRLEVICYYVAMPSNETLSSFPMAKQKLPLQSEDFPGWYQAVVREAGMAENGLAKGSMVIKPWGYAIWEQIQRAVDDRIKATGHENVYFPALIPESLLAKEADHVEGFAPEVIVATHSGGKKLEEPLILRPTSEAVIWDTYSRWVQSYRDLPLMYNQWENVFRTSEFLWQEGHTAHETEVEAIKETLLITREVYIDTIKNVLMIPGIVGRKSETEKFPGAEETITYEAMMRDRKALQSCTSHYLGQNFAKAYDVQFQSREGEMEYAYATSWGISTRIVGALIMAHGDDAGLRLPSAVAPKQVVIVPIYRSDEERDSVVGKANELAEALAKAGVRVKVDDRDEYRPGFKFAEWELKGVPFRVELGPRDIESGAALVSSRLGGEKQSIGFDKLTSFITEGLVSYDEELYAQAKEFQQANIYKPKDYADMCEFLNAGSGFVIAPWNGKVESERQVTGLKCIITGEPAAEIAIFAQAY